eukprot:Polyplicarium_translucidae@DN789_c0_g1_i1.p1
MNWLLGWKPSLSVSVALEDPPGSWLPVARLSPPTGGTKALSLSSARFSPDGRFLATAGALGIVRVHDLSASAAVIGAFEGHEAGINDLNWDNESRCVVTASSDRSSQLFDVARCRRSVGVLPDVSSVAVMAASFLRGPGVVAFTGGHDGALSKWDLRMLQRIQSIRGHGAPLTAVCVSSDDRVVATGSFDGYLRLWRPSLQLLRTFTHGPTADVVFSSNDRILLCNSIVGGARLLDLSSERGSLPLAVAQGLGTPAPTERVAADIRRLLESGRPPVAEGPCHEEGTPGLEPLESAMEPGGYARSCFWRGRALAAI